MDGDPTDVSFALQAAPTSRWEPPPTRRRGVARTRVLGAAIAVVLAAGVVAAVAKRDDGPSMTASQRILAASDENAAAGPASFGMTVRLSADGESLPSVSMTGEVDPAAKAVHMVSRALGNTSEVVIVDGVEYIKADGLPLPAGKSWVSITTDELGSDSTVPEPSDPGQQLGLLRGLVGDPTVLGHDQLDGVSVTHYSIKIDEGEAFAKMKQAGKALGNDSFARGLEALQDQVGTTLPAEVWLDDAGRVRKMSMELSFTVRGAGTVNETSEIHYTDLGRPVTVTAPDPEQVVSIHDVPGIFGGSSARTSNGPA